MVLFAVHFFTMILFNRGTLTTEELCLSNLHSSDSLCNILMYISSLNTWASRDSPLAHLVKELDLCYICV